MVEPDTFWQIRTGLLTIHNSAIPAVDPFSWTAHGEPWTINSWGFNVAMGAVYRLGGLPAVTLTCAALAMAAAGMVLLLARRLGASPVAAATLLLLSSPLLIAWLSARPQLVDYVAVPALVLLLHHMVERQPAVRFLLSMGGLMIVWVNLHAAALLGVAIVGATAMALLVAKSTRHKGYWCVAATAAALAASLVNPYGVRLFTQSFQVKKASTGVVDEWQHLDPSSPTEVAMLLMGLVALTVAVRRRDVVFTAALTVSAVGAVTAIRLLPILLLLALPVLAVFASHPAMARYAHTRRIVLVPGAVVGVAAFVALALPSLSHIGQPDSGLYPAKVVQLIPPHCRLFNTYALGGFVLLQRPDVSVSLDSRNDLYGAERVIAAERVLRGQGDLANGLRGAGCVLVSPTSGLALRLKEDPRWLLAGSEAAAALFIRR